jgi:hypothetical protein
MIPHNPADPQLFLHLRVVLGIILGLSITTLLRGVAMIVEHPQRYRWSWIHLGWVLWTLFAVIAFWWWEFRLTAITHWTFESYVFVLSYCSLYFLLSTMLFPADLAEYGSYEAYFLARRRWFFGMLILITAMDVIDTALKGAAYFAVFGWDYPARALITVTLCIIGIISTRPRVHIALLAIALLHQIYFIGRYYFVLS